VAGDGSAVLGFAAPGDVNLDGQVNVLDLVAISAGGKFGNQLPAVWADGDFNYDGVVNVLDLVAISAAGVWGTGNYLPLPITKAAVPEPATGLGLIAALAGLAAAGGRRRRRAGC